MFILCTQNAFVIFESAKLRDFNWCVDKSNKKLFFWLPYIFFFRFWIEVGFTGFTNANFIENLKSDFNGDISFFVVFGVFFPTACGVLAGVNMSGDLKEPSQNIPEGSVAALGLW